jgi:hypothetical protein
MTTSTITWKPVQLLCKNGIDGRNDVVSRIVFAVIAERDGLSGRSVSEVDVAYDPGQFTDFRELSEQQVVGWIMHVLGRNGVQLAEQEAEMRLSDAEAIAKMMASQTFEPMTPRGLPWN